MPERDDDALLRDLRAVLRQQSQEAPAPRLGFADVKGRAAGLGEPRPSRRRRWARRLRFRSGRET